MTKTRELVEMIRSALAEDADDILRQRALNACDRLMVVMSVEPGQPLPVPPQPAAAQTAPPASAPALASPASPPPAMQMLDALIAKLKSELPREDQPAEPAPDHELRIPFVPIPGLLGTGS